MRQFNQRGDIQIEHLPQALAVDRGKLPEGAKPGIVDKQINFESGRLRLSEQLQRSAGRRQVDRDTWTSMPGCAVISSARSRSSRSCERATRMRDQPRAASCRANSSPMPELAPVISAYPCCSCHYILSFGRAVLTEIMRAAKMHQPPEKTTAGSECRAHDSLPAADRFQPHTRLRLQRVANRQPPARGENGWQPRRPQ